MKLQQKARLMLASVVKRKNAHALDMVVLDFRENL